jgi:hypothetical protein
MKRCCGKCVFGERPRGAWWKIVLARWPGAVVCFQCEKWRGSLGLVAAEWKCRNFRTRREPTVYGAPPEPSEPGVRYIKLTKGKYATVDAADYEWLAKYKWHASGEQGSNRLYACRNDHGRVVSMHREIMKPPRGKVVDHINGDGIYNRRSNMRNCKQLQNSQNTRRRVKEGKKSKYRGVFPRGSKWQATVQYDGKSYYLGLFDSEVEAAMQRDRKAIEMAGVYAMLNFPREVLEKRWPELRERGRGRSKKKDKG